MIYGHEEILLPLIEAQVQTLAALALTEELIENYRKQIATLTVLRYSLLLHKGSEPDDDSTAGEKSSPRGKAKP